MRVGEREKRERAKKRKARDERRKKEREKDWKKERKEDGREEDRGHHSSGECGFFSLAFSRTARALVG